MVDAARKLVELGADINFKLKVKQFKTTETNMNYKNKHESKYNKNKLT